jgi:hypothetical protein
MKDFKKVFGFPFFRATVIPTFTLALVMQGNQDLTPGRIAVPPLDGLGLGLIFYCDQEIEV